MRKLSLLVSLLMILGCVPKRQKMDFTPQYPSAPSYVQPQFDDSGGSEDDSSNSSDPSIEAGELKFSDLLQIADNLHRLLPANPSLQELTQGLDGLINQQLQSSLQPIESSAYFKVFLKEATPQVDQFVVELKKQLKGNVEKLSKIFLATKLGISTKSSVSQLATAADRGFSDLGKTVDKQKLYPALKEKLQTELAAARKETAGLLFDLAKIDQDAKTLTVYAEDLDARLSSSGYNSAHQDLLNAQRIGAKVDQIKDPQTALAALIYIWNLLSAKERQDMIGKMSPELFKYLSDQSASDLECIGSGKCDNIFDSFFTGLSKIMGVLPSLKEYGPEKIQSQINSSAIAYIRSRLRSEIYKNLQGFGKTIESQVRTKVDDNITTVDQFGQSFGSQLVSNLPAWAKPIFDPAGTGPSQVPNGKFIFRIKDSKWELKARSESITESAMGSWLNYLVSRMQNTVKPMGQDRHALFSALNYAAGKHLVRHEGMVKDSELTYESLERVQLIRGLGRLASYAADYHRTNFNDFLGDFKLGELFPDQPKGAIDKAIFPQDAGFLLSLSALGSELHEFERQRPPIFLLTTDRALEFYNRKKKTTLADPSQIPVMAGVMDVTKGRVESLVKSESISRAILALVEFFDATEGIGRTKVERLRKKDLSGDIPLDQLIRARKDLRQFIIGLTNLLTNVAIQENGLVATDLNLTGAVAAENPTYTLANQALALEAMVQAARITGLEIYTWDAVSLLNTLNGKYFDPEAGFYKIEKDRRGSVYGIVAMLRAISIVKPSIGTAEAKAVLSQIEEIQIGKLSALGITLK